ncbi:MAG: hypothetical protein WD182_00540 [Bacteroidota bacterium]
MKALKVRLIGTSIVLELKKIFQPRIRLITSITAGDPERCIRLG